MSKMKFKKIIVFVCALTLFGSFASAKRKTPPKAYSFIAEGGKASQGECDGERKLPRLKKLKEFSKYGSYMGSEKQDPEIKGKADDEMWKHFYRDKGTCNSVLAKTPSSVQDQSLTKTKAELPPDEAEESDDEAPQGQQDEAPNSPDAE
jgi:hypothetical protein